MLGLKAILDFCFVLFLLVLPDFFPKYMISRFVGFSTLVSRVPNMFIAIFVSFSKNELKIHPFVFFSFIFIILVHTIKYTKMYIEDKKED